MESILNLQLSLFGSFINIKPKNEIVIQLLTNLKEENFIPGTSDSFLAVLWLCCCAAFSVVEVSRDYSPIRSGGFSGCRAQALGHVG